MQISGFSLARQKRYRRLSGLREEEGHKKVVVLLHMFKSPYVSNQVLPLGPFPTRSGDNVRRSGLTLCSPRFNLFLCSLNPLPSSLLTCIQVLTACIQLTGFGTSPIRLSLSQGKDNVVAVVVQYKKIIQLSALLV